MIDYKYEQLAPELFYEAIKLLEKVFTEEQNIPSELIPLGNIDQYWWCVRSNERIVGVIASWKTESDWHMGRLAIDSRERGHGLASKLLTKAIEDLFHIGTEAIHMDARDIAVKIISKLGGQVIGKPTIFYDCPITPMLIRKEDFQKQ